MEVIVIVTVRTKEDRMFSDIPSPGYNMCRVEHLGPPTALNSGGWTLGVRLGILDQSGSGNHRVYRRALLRICTGENVLQPDKKMAVLQQDHPGCGQVRPGARRF